MPNHLNSVFTQLGHFVFPQLCIHCKGDVERGHSLLCSHCWDQIELLDPSQRCQACFNEVKESGSSLCKHCEREPPLIYRKASAFSYQGPVRSIIRSMKYGGRQFLGDALGAFLLAQWARLEFPTPDYLVPVPLSPHKWLQRGYNQSHSLSGALAKELGRPIYPLLRRRAGDFSQAGLSRAHRRRLSSASFSVHSSEDLRGKVVLLLDDVCTTGTTLDACAEAILRFAPCFVYAMTLAKTEEGVY